MTSRSYIGIKIIFYSPEVISQKYRESSKRNSANIMLFKLFIKWKICLQLRHFTVFLRRPFTEHCHDFLEVTHLFNKNT